MTHFADHHREWEQYNGQKVAVHGLRCKLRVDVYRQKYPYEAEVISVHAEPINKRSKRYLETKRELGDDWSTDILESDVELQVDVLLQLGHYGEGASI